MEYVFKIIVFLNVGSWVPCCLGLEYLFHPAFVAFGIGTWLAVPIEQRKIEPLVNLYLHLNLCRVYSGL